MDQIDSSQRESATDYLNEIFAEHRNSRDSGEGLLDALVRLLKRNRLANLPVVREQLLDWVANMDEKHWGIALEALMRDPDPRNAGDLEALLRDKRKGLRGARFLPFGRKYDGWREAMILALLRLQHLPGLDLYHSQISRELKQSRPTTLTLLQHLYPLDYDSALDWSAILFARLIQRRTNLGMTVAGHLCSLSAIGPCAVIELVRRTCARNREAGDQLRNYFTEELKRPWVRERIGWPTADALVEHFVASD